VPAEYNFQATTLAWNCNGSTLAVGYGKTNLVSWCDYHSCISLWGIFRREFNQKKPNENIEVDNCLTSLAFHPTEPSILAGGTHDGMIYIWKIFEEQPLKSKSEIDEYYHREAITKLVWVQNEGITSLNTTFNLMSCSTDGKILIWKPENKLRYPLKGILLSRKKGGET